MSHFYGIMNNGGINKDKTIRGHASSWLNIEAQSWQGKIRVELDVDNEGNNIYKIFRSNHGSSNIETGLIAKGKFNDFAF